MDGRSQEDKKKEEFKKKLDQIMMSQAKGVQKGLKERPKSDLVKTKTSQIRFFNNQSEQNLSQIKDHEIKTVARENDHNKSMEISEPVLSNNPVNDFNRSVETLKFLLRNVNNRNNSFKQTIDLLARRAAELPIDIVAPRLAALIPLINTDMRVSVRPYFLAQLEIELGKKSKKELNYAMEELKEICLKKAGAEYEEYCSVFLTLNANQSIATSYHDFLNDSIIGLWSIYFRALCIRLGLICKFIFNLSDDNIPENVDSLKSFYAISSAIKKHTKVRLDIHWKDLAILNAEKFKLLKNTKPYHSKIDKKIENVNMIIQDLIECFKSRIDQEIAGYIKAVLEKFPNHFLDYRREMKFIELHLRSCCDQKFQTERYYFLTAMKMISVIDHKKLLASISAFDILHFIIGYFRSNKIITLIDHTNMGLEKIKLIIKNELADDLCVKFDIRKRLSIFKEEATIMLSDSSNRSSSSISSEEDGPKSPSGYSNVNHSLNISEPLSSSVTNQSIFNTTFDQDGQKYGELSPQPPPLPPRDVVRRSIYIVSQQDSFNFKELMEALNANDISDHNFSPRFGMQGK